MNYAFVLLSTIGTALLPQSPLPPPLPWPVTWLGKSPARSTWALWIVHRKPVDITFTLLGWKGSSGVNSRSNFVVPTFLLYRRCDDDEDDALPLPAPT
jgi:hypothetical protein